jgi:HAE1 family hydrophobic/amphiphilic exporter-1
MKNTFVVLLAVIMIAVGGIYSAKSIKMEAMPNINIPVITTFTVYPGAAPQDVANDISAPLQKAISSIQGIKDVKTTSNENFSILISEFDYSADLDKAKKAIEDAIAKVKLPDSAQKPVTSRVSIGGFPIMTYSIESTKDINELSKFVNSRLTADLSGISGVSSIDVQGIRNSNTYIKLDAEKLKANNITLTDVQNAINANNISFPIGSTSIDDKNLTIRVSRKLKSIDDLKSVPILVIPNTTKLMGDSLSQIGAGLGTISKTMGSMGEMIGGNTQAIGILSMIQQSEGTILAQQGVLANPAATMADKMKAQTIISQSSVALQNLGTSLQQVLTAQAAKGEALSSISKGSSQAAAPEIKINTVFLKDVATIETAKEDVKFFTKSNYKEGLIFNVYKNEDANTVQVAADVQAKVDSLMKENKDIKFNKITDSSISVKSSVNGMMREGVTGAIFAMIVIALFLRDIKSTIISIISIPLSILIALILLPRFGITLNTMSLGGIAVAVGRIVDDSIVVIENIYRRFGLNTDTNMDKAQLIEEATHEVGSAITASTITTVAVFLPLSFISGIIGKVFIPFAFTVVISIIASLLVALTIVPAMSKYMLLNKNFKHVEKEGLLARNYKKVLAAALKHRVIVVLSSIGIFAISILMVTRIGVQFMPTDTNNIISAKLTMPVGTSAEGTNKEALKFEDYLRNRTDIESVASTIGDTSGSGNIFSAQSSNQGSFIIVLKDKVDKVKALDEIRIKTKEFDKANENITVNAQTVTGNQPDNLEVILNGDNIDNIAKAANLITNKIKNMDGLNNVTNNLSEKKAEISISVDSNKAAAKGISPIMAAGIVRSYLGFNKITTIDDGNNVDVLLGYQAKDLSSVDKVKNLEIQGMGDVVKIGEIADVTINEGPASILSLNGKQYASVVGEIKGTNTKKITNNAQAEIDSIKASLPEGVTYTLQGSNKSIDDGFSQMYMAMAVAIALVYVVMVLTFGEPVTPFAILFSLPFAAVGAIGALFIVGQPLTVSGMIGMLMLIGIVVTNAIVLLDRVKTNRKFGMNIEDSLLEAGSVRLRPIFMTAIATVMALIPLALGFSEGSLISQGLGIVVIGGLVVSTLLTLILVPVVYSMLNGYRKELKK